MQLNILHQISRKLTKTPNNPDIRMPLIVINHYMSNRRAALVTDSCVVSLINPIVAFFIVYISLSALSLCTTFLTLKNFITAHSLYQRFSYYLFIFIVSYSKNKVFIIIIIIIIIIIGTFDLVS